jgi:hypothetical protein
MLTCRFIKNQSSFFLSPVKLCIGGLQRIAVFERYEVDVKACVLNVCLFFMFFYLNVSPNVIEELFCLQLVIILKIQVLCHVALCYGSKNHLGK